MLILEILPFRPTAAAFLEVAHPAKHIALPEVVACEAATQRDDRQQDSFKGAHRESLHVQTASMTSGEIIQMKSNAYPMQRRIVSIMLPSGWCCCGDDPPTISPAMGEEFATHLCSHGVSRRRTPRIGKAGAR
jgi:hypothetical protein